MEPVFADNYQLWVDIGIPIVSALIGGLVTMLGVIITIKHEKNKDSENRISSVRPWIYSIDALDTGSPRIIRLQTDDTLKSHDKVHIYIKNTDNGIGIIHSLRTENKVYLPIRNNIMEKNTITEIEVEWGNHENLKNICLTICDIYGNPYQYDVIQRNDTSNGWQITEKAVETGREEKKRREKKKKQIEKAFSS